MFKLFIYGCMLFAVIYALPIAMNKVDQIIEQFGGMSVTFLGSGGPLPSIVDMAIVMCFMLGTWAIGVLITGFLWRLTDRVTGHPYYRREIQDMKTEIAEIKARLGIEDMAECHDHDYTGRENA